MAVHIYIGPVGDTRTHEPSLDMYKTKGLLTAAPCFPSAMRSIACSSTMLCSVRTQLIRWYCKNMTENVVTTLPTTALNTKPSIMYVAFVNISIRADAQHSCISCSLDALIIVHSTTRFNCAFERYLEACSDYIAMLYTTYSSHTAAWVDLVISLKHATTS